MAMPRMFKKLSTPPSEETGFLCYNILGFDNIVQYWRSFDHLEAYANSSKGEHFPAWVAFNKRMKNCLGDVGVWHESVAVKAGNCDSLYMSMPPHGLGKATSLVPTTGARSSAQAVGC